MLLCHALRIQIPLPILARSAKYLSSRRCYSQRQHDPPLTNTVGNPRDFYRFTSGVAEEVSSAGPCVRMEKLGEGSSNKAFKLTMANNKTVVARIPNPSDGTAFLTTASEVATMDFLRNFLYLPVPKVLAWSSRHAPGQLLALVWPDMDYGRKIQTIQSVVDIQQTFYGCLYYSRDAPPGSHSATVSGSHLPQELKLLVAKKFSIGPMVKRKSYSSDDIGIPSRNQYPPAEHISIIQRYLPVIPHLLPEEDHIGSYLYHAGFRTANIFVDDSGSITSVIDWQNSAANPLFVQNPPHFLDYNGKFFKLPEDYKDLDKQKQQSIRDQYDQTMMLYLYDDYLQNRVPLLRKEIYGGILNFRESLIRVQRKKSPFEFSPEDIRKHYEDVEGWNEIQRFWNGIRRIICGRSDIS
ncbi:kinase-like domain-containing protein [Aspergillus undulatus]|uniref:kinase-like domain-containing protein n=1 Tax=Aspergillus undulatus TaxID=1810928 RepID=UPI003CCC9B96